MTSKFNENGVITGIADCFCLSCQKLLKLKDVSEHISASDHQETFLSTDYVEKYKEDRIRKVKLGYYCEICNIVIQTLAKTGIHVNEVTHVNNKNGQQLKESDAGVVAFDDILIEYKAWHGLVDGSCLICSVDYSDEDGHKNEPTHILKLIQSKFELEKNKYVYRKIDGDSINCLICNTIIMEQSKETHLVEYEHKNNYIKCQSNKKCTTEKTSNYATSEKDLEKETTSDKVINKQLEPNDDTIKIEISTNNTRAREDLEKNSKDDIIKATETNKKMQGTDSENNLNSENQIVVCNKEGIEQVGNSNGDDDDDDDNGEIVTPVEALQKAKEFAKQNHLKYKRNSTYCKVCDVRISSSLKMMMEHVAESSHKEKATNKITKKMSKVTTEDFINSNIAIKNYFCHDIIINGEICLNILSFFMFSCNGAVLRCQACEVSLTIDEVDIHRLSYKHSKAMEMTPVITDFKSEFVREVRPKVYHCGYCNFIEGSLESLKNHLKSTNHLQHKSAAQQRLATHLPKIRDHCEMERLNNFMRMLFS